jgi:hypothetical protein
MAESAEKPRRWFQFHLSTAIVLMFAASGLVWVNVVEYEFEPQIIRELFSDGHMPVCGWPFMYWRKYNFVSGKTTEWIPLLGNIAVAALILAAVATVCEMLIRRKKHS